MGKIIGLGIVLVIGIAIVMWILQNILLFAGLGLIGWGIYELVTQKHIKNRRIQAFVTVSGFVLILVWAGVSDATNVENTSTAAIEEQKQDEQQEQIQEEAQTTEEISPDKENVQVVTAVAEQNDEEQAQAKNEQSSNVSFVPAVVTGIVDGDTIDVEIDGKKERLRLLLVDTPETKDPNEPVQPFGPEATEFAEKTLTGKEVKLEFDGPERDKYDRLLVYLWIGNKIFNQMLLEKGLARVAYVFDPPYTHYDTFVAAEKKAKDAKLGIWSIENYVQEDGFHEEVAATKVEPEPETAPAPQQQTDVYYARCADARAAGAAPIYKGEPGYRPALDRDGDGIACE